MRGLPQDLCKYVCFYANLQSTVCLVGGKCGKSGYQPVILPVPAPFAGKGLPWMLCRRGDTRAALGQGLCLPAGAGGEGCGPSGGVGETPVMGNYFLVAYFPPSLRLLLGFVLARSLRTGMFCVHVWAVITIHRLPPAPRC